MKTGMYNVTILAVLFVVQLGIVNAQEKQDELSFGLQNCIDYALENHVNAQNAKLEEQKAVAKVKEYTGLGLPQVNASVGFNHNIKVQTSFIADFISPATYGVLFQEGLLPVRDLGEPATFPAAFGTNFTGNASVNVSQLIFDGSYFVGLQASKTVKELSSKQAEMTQIQVVEHVSKAFFTVLVYQHKLELAAKNFARIDSLLREAEIMEQNGFIEKIDVSRIKINYNNSKVALTSSRDMLAVSMSLLKYQMGMAMGERLTLVETLEDYSNIEPIVKTENFDYGQRIEYSILETNDMLNDLDIKNYKMQYLPKMYGYFSAGYTAGGASFSDLTQFNSSSWFDFQSWGLTLNIPIYDGFQKRYAMQQRRLSKLQIEGQIKNIKQGIDVGIQTAETQYLAKSSVLEVQKENMDLADEVYRISKVKYKEGVGSNAEVLDADSALKESQTNYYSALYEALIARIEMEKAYGTLLKGNK